MQLLYGNTQAITISETNWAIDYTPAVGDVVYFNSDMKLTGLGTGTSTGQYFGLVLEVITGSSTTDITIQVPCCAVLFGWGIVAWDTTLSLNNATYLKYENGSWTGLSNLGEGVIAQVIGSGYDGWHILWWGMPK